MPADRSHYRPVPAPGGWRWERIPRRPIWPAWRAPLVWRPETRAHVLSRVERAILWTITTMAAGVLILVIMEIFS